MGPAPSRPPGRRGASRCPRRSGSRRSDTLCIHLVRAGPADVATLAARGCAVAHCPRSNRAHGHGDAEPAALLGAGLRLGVGTDSALSIGPLDLLAEARLAASLAGLDPMTGLGLCTLEAARALAMDADIGSLTIGKWADCVVIRPKVPSAGPPAGQALECGPGDVVLTILGGGDVHRAGGSA
jgi:5-methylthioadenosine/S-adenosylhomocysteine deaminase